MRLLKLRVRVTASLSEVRQMILKIITLLDAHAANYALRVNHTSDSSLAYQSVQILHLILLLAHLLISTEYKNLLRLH